MQGYRVCKLQLAQRQALRRMQQTLRTGLNINCDLAQTAKALHIRSQAIALSLAL